MDARVREAMEPYFSEVFGNPSSIYTSGRNAKRALADARERVAHVIGARADEILFTGGGTESDALALFGVMRTYGGTLITSPAEHHAVLYNAESLKKEGYTVVEVHHESDGDIDYAQLESSLTDDVTLVSLMYANNEIGTVLDIPRIGKMVKSVRKSRVARGIDKPIYFHTDACQAAGQLTINVQELGVDMMTLNGSKIYGPKGVGMLYVKKGIKLSPLWKGGGQERRLRSGTENVPGIMGFATALEIADAGRVEESVRLTTLRDMLMKGIMEHIPKVVANGPMHPDGAVYGGHATRRLPNNVNVSILDIEGEALLLYLDAAGIEASTGSACDSETLDPSHVILATGKPYEFAHASMRFTLGRTTTAEDVAYVLEVLPECVKKLRAMSPVVVDMDATHMSHASVFAGEGLPHWERGKKLDAGRKIQDSENVSHDAITELK